MPTFTYKASQVSGEIVSGEKTGANTDEILNFLHEQNLQVIGIEEKVGFNLSRLSEIELGDVSINDKVVFARQLATMLSAGLPITQSVETLVQQTKYAGLRRKLTEVYKDLQGGMTLSSSFSRQKVIFSELQLSLIEAGEKSGNLVEIMEQVAIDMRDSAELRGKIRGAMIYPIVVFATMIIVVAILMIYMVPSVVTLYESFGVHELPLPTMILIWITNAITSPLWLTVIILSIVGIVVTLRSFYNTLPGRVLVDKLMLTLPVFGDLIAKIEVLQMSRLLSMLLKSGIPIIDALKSTAKSLNNYHFKHALEMAATDVAKGQPIAIPLAKSKVIPIIVVKLISTGEQTGKLDAILAEIASFYKDQVDEMTSNLTKLLEPIILLVAGVVVGFLAIAIYFPIYNLATIIK